MSAGRLLAYLLLRADADPADQDCYTADELALWPPEEVLGAQRAGLLQETTPGTCISCDACLEAHDEEVVWIEEPSGSPRRGYLICPQYGRVRVNPERRRRWRFDADALARCLSEQFGAGAPLPLVRGRAWQVGWVTCQDTELAVCLGLGLGWSDGAGVLARVETVGPHPLLWLLVGSRPAIPGAGGVGFVAVADVLRWEAGQWLLDHSQLSRVVTSSSSRSETSPNPSAVSAGNGTDLCFKPTGAYWEIIYHTHRFTVPSLNGLPYLALLLQNPGRDFRVLELVAAIEQTPVANLSTAEAQVREAGLRDGHQVPGDPVLTARERTDYQAELTRIGTLAAERALTQEECATRDWLEKTLRGARGKGGRIRWHADQAERERSRVTGLCRRAIAAIDQQDAALGLLLRNSIKMGHTFSYAPDQAVRLTPSISAPPHHV